MVRRTIARFFPTLCSEEPLLITDYWLTGLLVTDYSLLLRRFSHLPRKNPSLASPIDIKPRTAFGNSEHMIAAPGLIRKGEHKDRDV